MAGRLAISSENIGTAVREPVPAAQYVRMSTEHQRYSTENQSDAILQYAVRYGFDIVRTYADNGKSGLRLDGRDALKQLLVDVAGGSPGFKAVLVYDVSRWGRFQDADESAYYEYVCRRSGVEIRYCAEQFENDGSVASTIVKTVKRAMAGEYSRELSAKVFAGQCRLIELGFRQGGHAGYGLRRRLVDQNASLRPSSPSANRRACRPIVWCWSPARSRKSRPSAACSRCLRTRANTKGRSPPFSTRSRSGRIWGGGGRQARFTRC